MKNIKNKFIIAVLMPLVVDFTVTLIGQPAAYWDNFSLAREGSPGKILLETHPVLFVLWGVLYVSLIIFLLRKLSTKYSLPLGLLVYTGHAWGSASWIPRLLEMSGGDVHYYWYVSILYFSLLAIILSLGIKSTFK